MKKAIFILIANVFLILNAYPCQKAGCSLPPIANFEYSQNVADSKSIRLVPEGSRDLNQLPQALTYTWYFPFDDSTVVSDERGFNKVFSKYGTYEVKLIVRNEGGFFSEISKVIEVLAPTVKMKFDKDTLIESNTTWAVQVILSRSFPEDFTINFEFSGTATAGSDYTVPNPTSITVPAGSNEAALYLEILEDLDFESDETVIAKIVSTSNPDIIIESSIYTVTIEDDDLKGGCDGEAHVNPDGSLGGIVDGTSNVSNDSYVEVNAFVCNGSSVISSQILGYAVVRGASIDSSIVKDGAVVLNAQVHSNSLIQGNAKLLGGHEVNSIWVEGSTIEGNTNVLEVAYFRKCLVKGNTHIKGIGSWHVEGPQIGRPDDGKECYLEDVKVEDTPDRIQLDDQAQIFSSRLVGGTYRGKLSISKSTIEGESIVVESTPGSVTYNTVGINDSRIIGESIHIRGDVYINGVEINEGVKIIEDDQNGDDQLNEISLRGNAAIPDEPNRLQKLIIRKNTKIEGTRISLSAGHSYASAPIEDVSIGGLIGSYSSLGGNGLYLEDDSVTYNTLISLRTPRSFGGDLTNQDCQLRFDGSDFCQVKDEL